MRVTIDLEIPPNEIAAATELLSLLRALTDHAQGQANGGPASAVQAAVKIRNLPQLLEEQLRRLAASREQPVVVKDVAGRLATLVGSPEAVPTFDENVTVLKEVMIAILFHSDVIKAGHQPDDFMVVLEALPPPLFTSLKDKMIRDIMSYLSQPRPIKTDRDPLRIRGVAFAFLVNLRGGVAFSGALHTIMHLMKKAQTQAAAITMLGCLIEKAYEKFQDPSESERLNLLHLELSSPQIDAEFGYDLEYVSECFGWQDVHPRNRQLLTLPLFPVAAGPVAAGAAMLGAAGAGPGPAPMAVPVAAPPPPAPQAPPAMMQAPLGPPKSTIHPSGVVYSMAYVAVKSGPGAPQTSWLACGDSVGNIAFWSREGRDRPAKLVNLGAPHYYVTSMDFITNGAALVVAGQTFKSGPNAPVEEGSLFCYANPEDWNMVSTGHLVRPKSIRIPAVRAITEDGGYIFISGETILEGGKQTVTACVYDMAGSASFSILEPVETFTGHSNNITAITPIPSQPKCFATGSLDKTVLLWDRRHPKTAVANLGTPTAGCHSNLISTIDARDNLILTGSADSTVACWDIRSFGQPTAQQALFRAETRNLPVSKVAFGPAWAGAAVATSQALFALDVTPACTGNRFSFIAEGVYADVKWDSMEGGRLYAAQRGLDGQSSRLDIFPWVGEQRR